MAILLSLTAVALAGWALTEFGVLNWHLPPRFRIEHWFGRNRFGLLLTVVLLVIVILAVRAWLAVPGVHAWWGARRWGHRAAVEADGSDRVPATRPPPDWAKVTSLVTAFTALAALIFTALSLLASRDQNKVAQEGLITDRYTRAVDQIGTPGAEHLQVRLGGVYALERLAQDSPRDRDTIVDVLAAFVRSSSPRTEKPCPATIPADIQAAFTVLARRPPAIRRFDTVDLTRTCLTRLNAALTDLSFISFEGSDLSDANFASAQLALVYFNDATLRRADLSRIRSNLFLFMQDADLSDAVLQQADLRSVDLGHSNLSGADLGRANLSGADLSQVTHEGTIVQNARADEYTTGRWWAGSGA